LRYVELAPRQRYSERPGYDEVRGIETQAFLLSGADPTGNGRTTVTGWPMHVTIAHQQTLSPVTFDEATHVFLTCVAGVRPNGRVTLDYFGVSLSTVAVTIGAETAYYYQVDQHLAPRHAEILAVLSRHFMQDYSMQFDRPCSLDSVFTVLGNRRHNGYRWRHEQLEAMPISKISGTHHVHFTAAEVWGILTKAEKLRAYHAFRLPRDANNAFMAGVMLWLVSLDSELFHHVVNTDLLDAEDFSAYLRKAKRLSVQAKSYQNLVAIDLRQIFEAEVLPNRGYGSVDWQTEKEHRTKPNVTRLNDDEVYTAALKLFTKNDPNAEKPRQFSWDNFWQARWQWSAAGSVHSQYADDLKYLSQDRALKNKFITLVSMPTRNIDWFLSRKPQIHAWASTKYEWGKMRAIYGTDLTSYILAHFAFFNVEDTLPSHFPVGKKARPSYVSSRMRATLHGAVPFCMDFEDFNSMHSTGSMAAVMKAYVAANHSHLSDEQVLAANWSIRSLEDVEVNDYSGTGTSYKARGTLLSGWRLTTFINSVLNYIYTQKIVGTETTLLRSVHNGDDVLLGVDNFSRVQNASRLSKKFNIRLQKTKSCFGGIAEFLRVDHARGDHGQYLTRNISTLIHSRIESKLALAVQDVLEAMEDRLVEFVIRGGTASIAARLRESYYPRISLIYRTPVQDLWAIKQIHRVAGGISEHIDANVNLKVEVHTSPTTVELNPSLPGVADYAVALRKTLELEVDIKTIADKVYSATIDAVRLTRKSASVVVTPDPQQARVYRGLYKAYADLADTALFGKAKMTGFVFDVLTKHTQLYALSRIIGSSKKPLEFLRVIT
jgi:hypothetical protein